MRNIKYIIFIIFSFFFNIFYVNAECTNSEISDLKKSINDIKITYKHLGIIEKNDAIYDNEFEVVVKNVVDDLYISMFNDTIVLEPSNGRIVSKFNNGKWEFDFYSKKCGKLIDTVDVFIPRFNTYSMDSLCEGIDGDDFPLCGKYYEYEVNYESFKERVNHYRITHNINNQNTDNENDNFDDNRIVSTLNKIFAFVIKYDLYFILSIIFILIIVFIILVLKKRRKRGVLE